MLGFIVATVIVLAAVSLPVMYIIEWKYGYGKWARITHGVCAVLGIVSLVAVHLLFGWKVASAVGDVRGWAEDFFCSYFTFAVILDSVLSGLLAIAAVINHPMRRMRMSVAILLPIAMILLTRFVASLAGNGQFAVDFYIQWLAPGLGLLPHIVPLCERQKKSD